MTQSDQSKHESLVQLFREIQLVSACTSDFDALMNRAEREFNSKEIGRLIFDPPGGKPLSAEEVVEWMRKQKIAESS